MKATYGRVSRRGVAPLAFSLDHIGPMTRTVRDNALMLQVIAGHDPGDPGSADEPVPDYGALLGQDVRGLRIGVIRHFYTKDVTVNCDNTWNATISGLTPLSTYNVTVEVTVRNPSSCDSETGITAPLLMKPFSLADFKRAVRAAVGQRRAS